MPRDEFLKVCFAGGATDKARKALYKALGCRQRVDSKAMEKIDLKLRDALGDRNTDYQAIQRIRERIKAVRGDTWRLMEEACESES